MEAKWLFSANLFVAVAVSIVPAGTAWAQANNICETSKQGSVACLTFNLIVAGGKQIGLPPSQVSLPGNGGIAVIGGQLSSASPLPSAASGIVVKYDPVTNTSLPTDSFGPILSEVADTSGARQVSVGMADQYFDFTRLDGIHLSNVPILGGAPGLGLSAPGNFNVTLRLNQFTIFGTYGLTKNVDISVVVPMNHIEFGGSLDFRSYGPGLPLRSATVTSNPSATGVGDVQFRIKRNMKRTAHGNVALGLKLRLPTGDPYSLLGAGALGIEPLLMGSATFHRVLPHANVGYQWNGRSVLTGDLETGAKRSLPGIITYAIGSEIVINHRITVSTDIIGQESIHADRAVAGYLEFDPKGQPVEGTLFYRQSYNSTSGSAGVKIKPGGKFLIIANVLFRLNHGGLSGRLVPLIGLSYTR